MGVQLVGFRTAAPETGQFVGFRLRLVSSASIVPLIVHHRKMQGAQ